MSRKKKLKYEDFLEILKDNTKENPFNIDNYDKQSVLDCRMSHLSHFNFYIEFKCEQCKKYTIKNLNRYRACYISNIQRCSNCIRHETVLNKYGVNSVMNLDSTKTKQKETLKKHYGVEHALQNESIKEKQRNTMIENYGVEHAAQSEIIKDKMKSIFTEKYGVDNPMKNDYIHQKAKDTVLDRYGVENVFQSEEIKEKIKKTNIERYGVKHIQQNEDIHKKTEETNIERYGVKSFLLTDECIENRTNAYNLNKKEILEKVKITNQKLYGVDWYVQSEDFKNKSKETCLDRYGVEFAMRNDEIKSKIANTKLDKYGTLSLNYTYCYNDTYFDSSWELAFYIYHKDKKHKIEREPKYFSYIGSDSKEHLYFVDFKVGNKYYEIKGDHLIDFYKNGKIKTLKNNNEKYKCMKKHNVILIWSKQIKKYINYVNKTYGETYLEQFIIDKNEE